MTADKTIDITPVYGNVYARFQLDRNHAMPEVAEMITKLSPFQRAALREYLNFVSIGLESAIGSLQQGDKGVNLRDLGDHLGALVTAIPDNYGPENAWECPKCGRYYDDLHLTEHSPKNPSGIGCTSDDCPGQRESVTPTVAIFVEGGNVMDVHSNVPHLKVILHDEDNIEQGAEEPHIPAGLTPITF